MLAHAVKPRVLFVVTTYPDGGGISSVLENFVADMADAYELHVAVVDERPGRRVQLAVADERVHSLGYTPLMQPLLFPPSVLFAARVSRALRRVVAQIEPDVVLVQDALNLSVPGVLATRRLPAKLVVMDHGTLTNVYDPRWYPMMVRRFRPLRRPLFGAGFRLDGPWRAIRWRIGVRYADEVWLTGAELKPWFQRAGVRMRAYTQSLPWGFKPPTSEQRTESRRKLGLAPHTTVLNVVSRLDGEKGLDTLLDALEDLSPLDSSVRLIVAGDGSLHGWFASEVGRRGLESTVSLVGRLRRDQVLRLHHASDFHVYAGTISCGVSICVLEAMACGVIPIVSDVPHAQVGLAGGCGWVFPAGSRVQLRAALAQALASDDDERRTRRQATLDALTRRPDPGISDLVDSLVGIRTPRPAPVH